jgi:hypothetical protein
MRRIRFRFAVFAAFAAFALSLFAAGNATPAPSRLPTQQRLLDFHSSFWGNLHHFLYATARARSGFDATRVAITAALADTAGFGALPAGQRDAWNAAVEYYQRSLARKDILFDTSLVSITNRVTRVDERAPVRNANLDSALTRALETAAHAYRAVWWQRHDAGNRRWIDSANVLLASHGDSAARAEERWFREPWPRGIRVDVTAYANWAGAYTSTQPDNVTITSLDLADSGTERFETLFHEVLHTMDDTLLASLQQSFRAAGKRWPRDPTHPFIFYTAGELTRSLMPGHVPFAESAGIWTRNPDYARLLPLLRVHWQAYLDGRTSMEEALRAIVAAY